MTQELVLSLFEYKDGELFSKITTSNKKLKPGVQVGCLDRSIGKGYFVTRINRKKYSIHRIIFLMHHGWLPEFIDHKDRNTKNNRIENLRPATKSQNAINTNLSTRNKSGYRGVSWYKSKNKWVSQIEVNGKKICLGYFNDPVLAHNAYNKASAFYHKQVV